MFKTHARGVALLARGIIFLAPLSTTAAIAVAAPGGATGPSSSERPYLVRSQPGVVLKSILSVGDAVPKGRRRFLPAGRQA
jgi:hypothetical protein